MAYDLPPPPPYDLRRAGLTPIDVKQLIDSHDMAEVERLAAISKNTALPGEVRLAAIAAFLYYADHGRWLPKGDKSRRVLAKHGMA